MASKDNVKNGTYIGSSFGSALRKCVIQSSKTRKEGERGGTVAESTNRLVGFKLAGSDESYVHGTR
jgi:hypothetical protein